MTFFFHTRTFNPRAEYKAAPPLHPITQPKQLATMHMIAAPLHPRNDNPTPTDSPAAAVAAAGVIAKDGLYMDTTALVEISIDIARSVVHKSQLRSKF